MASLREKSNSFSPDQFVKETCVKNYTEAEAEEYFKYMDRRDEIRKETTLNTTFQGLDDSMQKLYVDDLAKIYRECSFTYEPKSNNLSILSMKDKILSIIETNSVIIVQGPTGCGKTTQIPQFILDANIKKRLNCNIIVTQPRRIAAISIAKRVSEEGGWSLGSLVGYQVGMRKEVSHETRLTYCTTEVLLHHLINQKHMLDYTHIILDEIHERDQHLDFLLLVVKKLLQTNSGQVKIILMSATINVIKFARYFSMRVQNDLIPAPIIKIPEKRNFDIRTYYLDDIKNLGPIPEVSVVEPRITSTMFNFCSLIINALDEIDINANEEASDSSQRYTVLIFLPGIYEIEEFYNCLSSVYHKNKLWDLAILHSLVSDDNEQRRIFQKPPEGHRRIILSTNIAESSITVPDVKYVIDFCLVKLMTFDPVTHYQSLQLSWASKTNCIQRAGRTGRVMDGRVYRLVPKAFYNNILEDYSTPEIFRAPLANVVLHAKILDLDEPRILLSHALDPPILSDLANTILNLKEVGALVDENDSYKLFDGSLTDLGKVMASLPLDIRISKLIMLGHVFGVLRDTIILAASMSIKDVFSIEKCHPTVSSYTNRKVWARGNDSDCIAALNVYKMWQNEKANRRLNTYQAERQWAQRNGFYIKALFELDALVNEITIRLRNLGIKESVGVNKVIWRGADRDFVLQVALAGAFYPNYFIKRFQSQEIYKENIAMLLGVLDPMKTVYLRSWPLKQPGYLYAQKFQEIFSKCLGIQKRQVAISFNGSQRVYVQFREKEAADDSLQKISEFVYQAIKMRQANIPFKIDLLSVKEANEQARHYDTHKFERPLYFRRNFRKAKNDVFKIKPNLPGLNVTSIPLFIRTIISPGHFWAILDDDTTHKKLRIIKQSLNENALEKFFFTPKTSTIVAALLQEKNSLSYHRAIIEEFVSEVGELVDIFFIDCGRFSTVRFSDLRKIDDTTISKIPPLAFCCNLAFVQPSIQSNVHGQWSEKSKNYFGAQIKESKKIFGNIYSIVDSIINLELIVVDKKERRLNVNKDLIEKEYAMRREEKYLSKHNHELRVNWNSVNTMSIEEKHFYEEEQYDKHYLFEYPKPPKEKDCKLSTTLEGPYSPLEMELMSLKLGTGIRKINVDVNSINSVLLDNDLNQSRRLLVAQTVSQTTKDSLILRNTTLLPNIPGLAVLLALSFAPRMELRCNSRRTYYTGALCGLGPINDTNRSIFPNHDMEIQFDIEITMNDIKEINKLRHWINTGMQLSDTNDDDIIICQNKIKHILLALKDKQRKPRDPEDDYSFDNKWNRYNKYFMPSVRETASKYNIYPLHKALELRETDEQTEDMLRHLSKLQRLASEDTRVMKNVATFCKLCGKETFSVLELRGHLYSEQHMEKEKLLIQY